jgi:Holliday junction resolvase
MGNTSRDKGKRGELEFCQFLRDRGVFARRGQQYAGNPEAPDVVTGLERAHFEVKRTERLNLYDAMEQAAGECGSRVPVVAHRRNRGEWLAILPMEKLVQILKELDDAS